MRLGFHAIHHDCITRLVSTGAPVSVTLHLENYSTATLNLGVHSAGTHADERAVLWK